MGAPGTRQRTIDVILGCTGVFAFVSVLVSGLAAQSPSGSSEWTTFGYDAGHTGWNRAEQALSADNLGQMRRLWKTVLLNTPHLLAGLSAPLVVNHAGRDLVVVAGSDIPPPGPVSLAAPT